MATILTRRAKDADLIVLGLTPLSAAAMGWPHAALTGMALVALGAARVLANRPGVRPETLLCQTLVYAMLYTVFLGARLHAFEGRGVDLWFAVDLSLSLAVLAGHGPLVKRVAGLR